MISVPNHFATALPAEVLMEGDTFIVPEYGIELTIFRIQYLPTEVRILAEDEAGDVAGFISAPGTLFSLMGTGDTIFDEASLPAE
jgi:hypothetical protein